MPNDIKKYSPIFIGIPGVLSLGGGNGGAKANVFTLDVRSIKIIALIFSIVFIMLFWVLNNNLTVNDTTIL